MWTRKNYRQFDSDKKQVSMNYANIFISYQILQSKESPNESYNLSQIY